MKIFDFLHDPINEAELLRLLTQEEISALLQIQDIKLLNNLFSAARKLQKQYFGKKIFLYGFIYLSTYCQNDCCFCNYRFSSDLKRYRKNLSEILVAAENLASSGVNLIDLTMGEDPYFLTDKGFEKFCSIIKDVKKQFNLPIMISPGVLNKSMLIKAKEAGADWYACYQETHNKALFKEWRLGQSYEKRFLSKIEAQQLNFLIEEGILSGSGAKTSDLAQSIISMQKQQVDQMRVMTYVPSAGNLNFQTPNSKYEELIAISLMRIMNPQTLIPASLDIEGLTGLKNRLMAGANVVTSIVPAGLNLAGVARTDFDIENNKRSPQKIIEQLVSFGYEPASAEDYKQWIYKRLNEKRL